LAETDLAPTKLKRRGMLGDLKALAFPLDDVVVPDYVPMTEVTDAIKIFWSRTPSGGDLARLTGEAAVVVGGEPTQDSIGGVDVGGVGQAQFAGEAILEYAQRGSTLPFWESRDRLGARDRGASRGGRRSLRPRKVLRTGDGR